MVSSAWELRRRARQAYRAGGFVATTATLLPLFVAHQRAVPEAERDAVRDLWVRRWARALLDLFSITVLVHGSIPPPTRRGDRGRLIVSNHRSAIDIGVLLSTLGGTMVSRADLASWPVVGAAARSVGTVFVDRSSSKSGALALRAIQRQLEEGRTITVFPEGTTFSGDEVRPFHRGAFVAAALAGAEIVPVGLAYPSGAGAAFLQESFLDHLGRIAKGDATQVGLAVGPAIVPEAARAASLADRAHAEVRRLVGEARAIVGP